MAFIVMVYIVMAYIVMARFGVGASRDAWTNLFAHFFVEMCMDQYMDIH